MKSSLLLLLTILSFGLTSQASKEAKSFLPVTKVDIATSTFTWKGTKKLGDNHYGPIKMLKADVKLKKGKVVSGSFTMDMNSIDSKDMPEGPKRKDLVKHLKSADFFNVADFPIATLTLKKISGGKATGTLTIMGVPKPIIVPYTQVGNKFEGTMTFDRTKFGMTYKSKNYFKKLIDKKIINNDVTIKFIVNLI